MQAVPLVGCTTAHDPAGNYFYVLQAAAMPSGEVLAQARAD